ncbi:hypothetical protein FRC02_007751 [Tulasnella sp. 418]|nr:hypothetical protein FRC02_007751 [Tulasnella sp. 418]
MPSDLREQVERESMVAKLSWAQAKRIPELRIIEETSRRMRGIVPEDRAAVEGHVPDLIASRSSMNTERKRLGKVSGSRVKMLRTAFLIPCLFRRLKPITELGGTAFFRAWWNPSFVTVHSGKLVFIIVISPI